MKAVEHRELRQEVSWMDTSCSKYDRLTLMVDGAPFFYNGIQIRVDKTAEIFNYSEEEIGRLFRIAREDGFTVVNAQIRWMDIQPDLRFRPATSEAYENSALQDGISGVRVPGRIIKQLKFCFPEVEIREDTSAKIRVFLKGMQKESSVWLYGIGGADRAVHCLGKTPDYDPVDRPQFYDYDVTDYLRKYCGLYKEAEFFWAAQENGREKIEVGDQEDNFPILVISRENVYDWTQLEQVVDWADQAGIKLEILWFGTDTVSMSVDWRVPYYVFQHFQKSLREDGSPFLGKKAEIVNGIPGTYWFLMCKNDPLLRKKERTVLRDMFRHIEEHSRKLSDPHTVIGCQVANEPAVGKLNMKHMAAHCFCPVCRQKKGTLTDQEFRDRTMWEYCNNLASGIKESDYPVWTRVNNYRGTDGEGVEYNEKMRHREGTQLDFIGFDPYSPDIEEIYRFGHSETYSQGKNLPIVMENSGTYSNTDQLIMAALAGGSFYNVYDLCGPDTNGLYDDAPGHMPVPHGSYVEKVRKLNHMLNKLRHELATKKAAGAGGSKLLFFNALSETSADAAGKIGGLDIQYMTSAGGVGIAIDRQAEILLASSAEASFLLCGITDGTVESVTEGYLVQECWVGERTHIFAAENGKISIPMEASECVRIKFVQPYS